MRKLSYFTIVALASSIVLVSCSKKEEIEVQNDLNATSQYEKSAIGHIWKWPNDPFTGDDEPACIPGWSNCLEYCCVTPKTVSDFIAAIDSDNVRTFLNDMNVLIELGQGFEYYEQLLKDVRDGNKYVMYYRSQNGEKVMILYGDSDVNTSKFDAAQALSL
jgi:hypothetical protein